MKDVALITTKEFQQVHGIISMRRSQALQTVNNENLLTAWEVGGFVSERLRNSAWGSKTVMQLSEYLRMQDPTLRGYSRRNIYNMVAFYDAYSTFQFIEFVEKHKLNVFVQTASGQIENKLIVQTASAQLQNRNKITQLSAAQFPNFLTLTTLSNHFEILNSCGTIEERIFYILYSYKEKLNVRELRRCLANNTFSSILGNKQNLSKGLKKLYPQIVPMLKDTVFIDFLGLPKHHSEKRLQNSILDNMKDFILELGKDFLFYGQEYPLQVGSTTFKIDLLFFHRGLQCLVAIELKKGKFQPSFLGQLEFYLEALDRDERRSNENPSIGILLCQEADKNIVEYAMSRSMSPTMIAKYKKQLVPKEVLQRSLDNFIHFLDKKNIKIVRGCVPSV